jgi:Fe2+ or Zn2+ uptake regulation protein
MPGDFPQLLKSLQLKVTPQRLAILDIMLAARTYLSPEEVQREVQLRAASKVGLPTIYRNLEELSSQGVISKILHPNRQLYYYFCANRDHHHHFVCLSCRTVQDIHDCGCAELAVKIDGQVELQIMQALGTCRRCVNSNAARA